MPKLISTSSYIFVIIYMKLRDYLHVQIVAASS